MTADVVSEDTIIKWYKEGHSVKGKSVFLEQMSKFIEWLQNAEEGTCPQIYLFSLQHRWRQGPTIVALTDRWRSSFFFL